MSARALQAQARCLVKGGKKEEALEILSATLAEDRYEEASDPHGRLIVPDAHLSALHVMRDQASQDFRALAIRLQSRLCDYTGPRMPARQRRFLMRQLEQLLPDEPPLDMLAAEDLAASYLESESVIPKGSGL